MDKQQQSFDTVTKVPLDKDKIKLQQSTRMNKFKNQKNKSSLTGIIGGEENVSDRQITYREKSEGENYRSHSRSAN